MMDIELFKKRPKITNTLVSDSYTFTGAELMGGISFSESVNSGEDYTIGSCVISTIEFQLENLNYLIDDLLGKAFTWKQAVETSSATHTEIAVSSQSKLICLNGDIAYVARTVSPYLSIWDATIPQKIRDMEPPLPAPVLAMAVVDTKLYCLHNEEPYVTAFTINGENLTQTETANLNEFQIGKIKYMCKWAESLNLQGNLLKRYKVDLYDMSPVALKESICEYVQMGVFIAEKPTKVNDTRIKLKCSDQMSIFDVYVDDWIKKVKHPLTLKAYLQSLCNYVGVTFVDSNFLNYTFSVKKNYEGENVSGLQVLRWIVEVAACFACMDNQGRLVLKGYTDIAYDVDNTSYNSVQVEDYVTAKVDLLKIRVTETDIGVVSPANQAGKNVYIIENNPLLYADTQAELQPTADKIFGAIKDISYKPFTMVFSENPLIRAGDIINITTRKGMSFKGYIMSRSMKKGLDTYEAMGNPTRETTSDIINQSIQQLRGKSHELTINIEKLDSTINDPGNGLVSQILQLSDKIVLKVDKNGVIAAINISPETIKISAKHLELDGLVTFANLTDGTTTISGSNIKTGTIDANRVNVKNINASEITVGELKAKHIDINSLEDAGLLKSKGTFSGRITWSGATISSSGGKIFIVAGAIEYEATSHTFQNGDVTIERDLVVSGHKNAVQDTEHYGRRCISAYETAEYYFGDIGEGKVLGGQCVVMIEDIFRECVNTNIPYQVFLTPYGNGSIYVSKRDIDRFVVSGDDIAFGWELKAKRRGYEDTRLEELKERRKKRACKG